MKSQSKKYYRLWDGGGYLATGYNDTSKEDLKTSMLELMGSDIDDSEWPSYLEKDADELAIVFDYAIEESDSPFPENENPGF